MMAPTLWTGPRSAAPAAKPTSGTSSRTGRATPPVCVTASTAPRSSSSRRKPDAIALAPALGSPPTSVGARGATPARALPTGIPKCTASIDHSPVSLRPSPNAGRSSRSATGVELVDEYAWLRADNWQEVMRDPALLGPSRSAPTSRPRTPTREATLSDTADVAGHPVRRDEGAHQGGRQLGAGPGRRL